MIKDYLQSYGNMSFFALVQLQTKNRFPIIYYILVI